MKENIFNTTVAVLGTAMTFIFGGWDMALAILIILMVVDYIMGITAGAINGELDSNIGFKGLLRKGLILVVIILGVLLDRLLNDGTWVFRTLVCYFYIANEGLSILENLGKCGVEYPQSIENVLKQLKEEEEVK